MTDSIADILYYLSFVTPLIFVPLFWRIKSIPKWTRIVVALLVSFLASVLLFVCWVWALT